jgi:hypothetical protein
LLVLLAVVAACDFRFQPVTYEWAEEVELDSGEVITVDRSVEFRESNSLAGDVYSMTETSATLAFRGELAGLAPWNVPLMPLVLYRDAAVSEWVIVASSTSCDVWSARGKPSRGRYWEFRLRAPAWTEVSLSESSVGRATNLFILYSGEAPGRELTLVRKNAMHASTPINQWYRGVHPDIRRVPCNEPQRIQLRE